MECACRATCSARFRLSTARSFRPDSGPASHRGCSSGRPALYDLAASSPELVRRMDELARERIGGLQKLAAEPHKAHVVLLATRWGSACLDLRRFLERNQISFSWLTLDDPNLTDHWPGPPPTESDCPTLRFADGTKLVRPQPREFAARLGLQTAPRFQEYDTVIIGGGPAGLAAAVYGASEGLRTIVVEQEAPGGQAETSSRMKTTWGFRAGSRARSSRAGRFGRPSAWAQRFSSRARLSASMHIPAASFSTTRRS